MERKVCKEWRLVSKRWVSLYTPKDGGGPLFIVTSRERLVSISLDGWLYQ
jgi:hypothetical protein